jgi:(p)ppGpp synthase/HD superfamily hydrolase
MHGTSRKDLIRRASAIAAAAHHGRMRIKGYDIPLITHSFEVALQLAEWAVRMRRTDAHTATAIGLLHDVVEDSDITFDNIREMFGTRITTAVRWLTDPPESKALPILERKREQADRFAQCDDILACATKVSDQLSHVRQITFLPSLLRSEDDRRDYCIGASWVVDSLRHHEALQWLTRNFDRVFAHTKRGYAISEAAYRTTASSEALSLA